MNAPFPFGFPAATAWYLSLYILTLAMHVVFMNYVLAGSLYLAVRLARPQRESASAEDNAAATILKDWLPFMLSAAITAGVAPLLFVQILYQREFYTANLLLFHRWMAVLPVLIVAFYLAYVIKSGTAAQRPALRAVSAIGTALGLLFVAWAWTENHALGLDQRVWPTQYASGSMRYAHAAIWPRLLIWVSGAFPTLAVLVAWQLRAGASGVAPAAAGRTAAAALANLGIGGAGLALVCGVAYAIVGGPAVRSSAVLVLAWPWLVLAVAGLVLQVVAWWRIRTRHTLHRPALWLATVGLTATIIGIAAVRESIRVTQVDWAGLAERHAAAAGAGGLPVFLVFAVLALGVIVACVRIARRAIVPPPAGP